VTSILFDDERYAQFLPFTYTRPVSEIRCGILTLREKWEHVLGTPMAYFTVSHLREKYPFETGPDNLFILGACFPDAVLVEQILGLKPGQCLVQNNQLLAARTNELLAKTFSIEQTLSSLEKLEYTHEVMQLKHLWDIFSLNDKALRDDFIRLTRGRTSQTISGSNTVIGSDIFIEPGAVVEASVLNASTGPIYIGAEAEVMEGCLIRGPFALGAHAVLKMGAKVYGATTLGPGCKVGGEVNNVVFFANSNKAHDGFLGNAVLGEWCNMGADSNNSNLKNNYEQVKLWSESAQRFAPTGLQFCGLMMADHSKCGINTMFNTGTVVGVSCNIFGAGFPRNFVPSFSWGGAAGMSEYQLGKAVQTATTVFARRQIPFDTIELNLLSAVYAMTAHQRQNM
jgi:UDP-N-acetylglucosamine diphosphorylase/glucosamine-1-phosphate N-acetyltransferase